MKRFLTTHIEDNVLLLQRLVLGAVIFPHGAQKLLGWFDGFGYTNTMHFFTETLELPATLAFLVIIGESLGALALMVGLGTRVAAFGIGAIMLGAIFTTHVEHGFFMNWFGSQQGEGFEFHILALALAIPLVVWGGGRLALDTALFRLFVKKDWPATGLPVGT